MPSPTPFQLPVMIALAALLSSHTVAAPCDRIPLQDMATRYGLPPATTNGTVLSWQSPYASLAFHTGTHRFMFNNRLFWLNGAVTSDGKRWFISRADAVSVVDPLLRPRHALQHHGYSLIVLDPGHGGSDPGTIGQKRIYEKKLVLDIAKRVKHKLNASNVAVRMTRSRDTALTLEDRPKLAASWGADAFVSIHANSAPSATARGIETFVIPAAGFPSTSSDKPELKSYTGNGSDDANTILAGLVQQGALAQTKAVDRGVKRARFAVLREANCPAALVEVGFLSNPTEASQLADPAYCNAVAEGIAQGILTYLVKAEAGP